MEYRQDPLYSSSTITSGRLLQHKVLRNTYMLLSMTILFSALCAGTSLIYNLAVPGPFLSIIIMFALLMLTQATRNSAFGLVSIFLFTGFLGYSLGPMLNMFINHVANGPQLVFVSLFGTGSIFFTLSLYTLITKKDFSFLGGILFAGLIALMICSLVASFFHLPMFQIAVSAFGILIASALILFDTSRIIHDGEQNYIMATIQLYLDFYMLFVNLLSFLGMTNNRD